MKKQAKIYKKPALVRKQQGQVYCGVCGRHWGCGEQVRRT